MRSYIDFNDGWVFHEGFNGELTTDPAPGKPVRLPHTAVELPFSYFDETSYQRPFTYQKTFNAEPGWAGRLVLHGWRRSGVRYQALQQVVGHQKLR